MLAIRRLHAPVLTRTHPLILFQAFATKPSGDEEKQRHARQWLSKLSKDSLPHNIGEISFSRSSGPGGQNVNKVNSKATLRVSLDRLRPIVPDIIYAQLPSSSYYAKRTDSLLIQWDASRKQNENIEGCWVKLYDLLREAGKDVVRGETSAGQSEKVNELKRRDNEARIKMKKAQSAKKSSRRGSSGD